MEWYLKNAERLKELAKKYRKTHPKKSNPGVSKKYVQKLKLRIFNHYSDNKIRCACCGENAFEFMTLDHKNNDGAAHRKEVGVGINFYRWIINNNFPDMFDVLCYNCNCAKAHHGKCPHKS